MIILKFCWILLIFSSPGFAWNQEKSTKDSYDQLMSFSEAELPPLPKINDEWPLAGDLEQDYNHNQKERGQRDTFDKVKSEPTPKVSQDDKDDLELQKAADIWYRNLMKNRANQKRSDSSKKEDMYGLDKIMDHNEMGYKAEPKLTEWNSEATVQMPKYTEDPSQSLDIEIPDLDMKLEHMKKVLKEQEELEAKNRAEMKKKDELLNDNFSDFKRIPMPDGVYERTLNNLGSRVYHHSKIPGQKDYKYKFPKLLCTSVLDTGKVKQKRRTMDPLEEIKLKTSMKMMNKGFGPVLPSSTLEAKQKRIRELEAFSAQNTELNFDSKRYSLNAGRIADIPNSYDKQFTNYDPLSASYQSDTDVSTYFDNSMGHLGPEASSIGTTLDKSLSLETFGDPALDFALYTGLSGINKVDVGPLTNIQGSYQHDTMLKTSHVEDDYSIKSEKMSEFPASYLKSYPYAVAKLMADDLHYRNRAKRRNLADQKNGRRKRSLDENVDYIGFEGPLDYNKLLDKYDNDSLAHVYDPTRIHVPLMRHRPRIICPILPQHLQQVLPEVNQKQLQAAVKPVENFKASFNLSNFMEELHKLRNTQKPKLVQEPVQPEQPLAVPVQQPVTEKPVMKTLAKVKPSGVRRFFGHFLNKQSTMNPDCVSITTSPDNTDNSTTEDLGTSSEDNSGESSGGSQEDSPGASPSATIKTLDNACNSPDAMKLNVAINAQVCGNTKTKQFHSNGSISLQPPYSESVSAEELYLNNADIDGEYDMPKISKYSKELELKTREDNELIEDYVKRALKSIEKEQANSKHITSQNVAGKKIANEWIPPKTGSNIYDMLLTGELYKEIAAVVIEFISKDSELTKLVPVLKQNIKDSERQAKSTKNYPIWNDTTPTRHQGSQVCYPLPPDLKEFYDRILRTAEEIKIHKKSLDEIMQKLVSNEITPRYLKLVETAELLKESRERSH